ncbi:ABA4-like family protein [Hymenobacter radiodurans]|uniref:ABA4-like family protein n=1 Tax=Hymenobacter radiodurans TaxID=2496028 RepID=UPI0010584667|nr:ABA4-like family protein [Hymenobacter radiodurans]
MLTPATLFSVANPVAMLGWVLLLIAPRWTVTRRLVLSGILPLALAVVYAVVIGVHYAGPEGSVGGFSSLADVALLFQDPWALLAGWVHYLCFDLAIGAWEARDAHRRGVPHLLLIPCLLFTFLLGPVGILLYAAARRFYPLNLPPSPATTPQSVSSSYPS